MDTIIKAKGYDISVTDSENFSDVLEAKNSFVVTDSNIYKVYGEKLRLVDKENLYVIPAGEESKTLTQAEKIADSMLQYGCDRSTAVIALGGGVVGDMAGFTAASYMRGVACIQVPTTLLAQVDSGIGGKTGVNLKGGKNCFGAFLLPKEVKIHTAFLNTLPEREIICGLGEVIKTALLDEEIFDFTVSNLDKLIDREARALFEIVCMCAKFKAAVVDSDFTEKGIRKILNVGHTVGHALETAGNYRLSHGEYVLNGIYYEMKIFGKEVSKKHQESIENLITKIIKPIKIEDAEYIAGLCTHDKKNSAGNISVMLTVNPGNVKEMKISEKELGEALKCL